MSVDLKDKVVIKKITNSSNTKSKEEKAIQKYNWISYDSNISEIEYLKTFLNLNTENHINYEKLDIKQCQDNAIEQEECKFSQLPERMHQRLKMYGLVAPPENIGMKSGAINKISGTYNYKYDNYYDTNDPWINDDDQELNNNCQKNLNIPCVELEDFCCFQGDLSKLINSKVYKSRVKTNENLQKPENYFSLNMNQTEKTKYLNKQGEKFQKLLMKETQKVLNSLKCQQLSQLQKNGEKSQKFMQNYQKTNEEKNQLETLGN